MAIKRLPFKTGIYKALQVDVPEANKGRPEGGEKLRITKLNEQVLQTLQRARRLAGAGAKAGARPPPGGWPLSFA